MPNEFAKWETKTRLFSRRKTLAGNCCGPGLFGQVATQPACGHPLPGGEGFEDCGPGLFGQVAPHPAYGHPLPGGEGFEDCGPGLFGQVATHPAYGHPLPGGEGFEDCGPGLFGQVATHPAFGHPLPGGEGSRCGLGFLWSGGHSTGPAAMRFRGKRGRVPLGIAANRSAGSFGHGGGEAS